MGGKIAYITFNDNPSGIFKTQVSDVINYLEKEFNQEILLVSFVSIRGFFTVKKKLRQLNSKAIVLPMFPGIKQWEKNKLLLQFYLNKYKIAKVVCRGIFSTNLALRLKEKQELKVVYDARGAYKSEWEEFGFGMEKNFVSRIEDLEKKALFQSDYRFSISNSLVKYWSDMYGFDASKTQTYSIVPCTIGNIKNNISHQSNYIKNTREDNNIPLESIVLVYSGSIAGWQSIKEMLDVLSSLIVRQNNIFILLMTESNNEIESFIKKHPNNSKRIFVKPNEVPNYLSICDYGLLIRNDLMTNRVASPTKFSEYLYNGLDVIISDNIGDYSFFVKQNNCGIVLSKLDVIKERELHNLDIEKRNKNERLALENFSKENFKKEYQNIINL